MGNGLFSSSLKKEACNCKLEVFPCDDRNIKCSGCSNVHLYCSCVGSTKVPLEERSYLKDQREKIGTKKKFQIGGIDNSVLSPTSRNTKQTKASDEEIYIKEFDTIMDSDQM
nr:uncharacterized protein LOC124809575 [Hydra vulgaris]